MATCQMLRAKGVSLELGFRVFALECVQRVSSRLRAEGPAIELRLGLILRRSVGISTMGPK